MDGDGHMTSDELDEAEREMNDRLLAQSRRLNIMLDAFKRELGAFEHSVELYSQLRKDG